MASSGSPESTRDVFGTPVSVLSGRVGRRAPPRQAITNPGLLRAITGRPGIPRTTQTTNANPKPADPYRYTHQDLLDRTNNIIQESLARTYDITQRQVEAARVQRAREFDPSPSPTSSTSTLGGIDPSEGWHRDQVSLNMILNARNEFSIMPSTWKMSLRGIPMPQNLFYAQARRLGTRPRIYAHTDKLEFRGVQALRRLMDVHGRITDLRDAQRAASRNYVKLPQERQRDVYNVVSNITRQIRRTLQEAKDWAEDDAGLGAYDQLPPNIRIIDLTRQPSRRDMRKVIRRSMSRMAQNFRDYMQKLPGFTKDEQRPEVPVIFGLVIYKHIVFIATLNGSDKQAVEHIPIQLNMGERTQHQWNALAIMLTICWARDTLRNKVQDMKIQPTANNNAQLSDPDA